nr:MAG: hypothetical protein [Molluscum contagiosum virus]
MCAASRISVNAYTARSPGAIARSSCTACSSAAGNMALG